MKLKILFMVVGIMCLMITVSAQLQKPLITNDSYKNWTELKHYDISPDGRYIWYEQEEGAGSGYRKLIVSSNSGKVLKEFKARIGARSFTSDSKLLIFNCGRDSIIFYDIAENQVKLQSGLNDAKILTSAGKDFLVYKSGKDGIVQNLQTGVEKRIADVKHYRENPGMTGLVIQNSEGLLWLSLPDLKITPISPVGNIHELVFDQKGRGMLLRVKDEKVPHFTIAG